MKIRLAVLAATSSLLVLVLLLVLTLPQSVSAFQGRPTPTPTATATPTPTPTATPSPTATATPSPTATPTPTPAPLSFITDGLSCPNGVCALQSGNLGANYGQNIAITGGSCGQPCNTLPIFTVVVGSLPPGLAMPATFGCCGDAIGGTPSQAGNFTFTIQVKDGVGDTARQAFSIAISAAAPLTITFPASCCPDGTLGTSYLQNFFLSGGVGPYTWTIASGQLPPGLQFTSSGGAHISGTPSSAGTFTFTVRVTDSTGAQASELGSIRVR
jgi:hypothetical protein